MKFIFGMRKQRAAMFANEFIKSFAVAGLVCMLLGGLGNIFGAMVAGFSLGLVEILSAAYLGTSLRDLFTFVILILILLYKPSGLFGTRVVDD